MPKLYCFVDETGQHTKGRYFFVSAVIVEGDKDQLAHQLIELEASTGKGTTKWLKTKDAIRTAYIRIMLSNQSFRGKLLYAKYYNTLEYVRHTVFTTAKAIQRYSPDYKAVVIVDGLRKGERNDFASLLRKQGVRTEKVRGAEDDKEPFIRLADALCGFLADVEERREDYIRLRDKALTNGMLVELGK